MNDNQLMFFNEQTDIYWHGAFMGAAVLLGSLLFWVFARRIKKGAAAPIKYVFLFGFPLAIILSRLEYCWFRQDEFSGGLPDILDVSMGGFGLVGAVAGVAIVIALTAAASKRFRAAELFDAAAPAMAAAICIGRMGSHFSGEEKGFELFTDFFRRIMFSVYSPAEDKIFLSVYPYEVIAAGVIFFMSIWVFDCVYRRKVLVPGTVAARVLLGYTLTQILFESWRSDSLFLVYLGFVRFNQVVCAVVLAVVLVVTCVKYTRAVGFRGGQVAMWLLLAAGIALAFVCEFFMAGGAESHIMNYSGMILGLVTVYIVARIMMAKAFRPRRRKAEA